MTITFNLDEFKAWIETLEIFDEKTYKGDWDWHRHATFSLENGKIIEDYHYYTNGCKSPEPDGKKIVLKAIQLTNPEKDDHE